MSTFLSLSENQSHKSSCISHWLRLYSMLLYRRLCQLWHRLPFSCSLAILSNFLERFTVIENRVIFHWGNLKKKDESYMCERKIYKYINHLKCKKEELFFGFRCHYTRFRTPTVIYCCLKTIHRSLKSFPS